MTPKEKAEKLVHTFTKYAYDGMSSCEDNGKIIALIAVDEILDMLIGSTATIDYWKEVKEEINKI